MSIIVRGMEMPTDCRECLMQVYHSTSGKTWCKPADRLLAEDFKPIPFDGRPDWCPLVELPERHGDLIDRDELLNASVLNPDHVPYITIRDVNGMTAVIEAEGVEE